MCVRYSKDKRHLNMSPDYRNPAKYLIMEKEMMIRERTVNEDRVHLPKKAWHSAPIRKCLRVATSAERLPSQNSLSETYSSMNKPA